MQPDTAVIIPFPSSRRLRVPIKPRGRVVQLEGQQKVHDVEGTTVGALVEHYIADRVGRRELQGESGRVTRTRLVKFARLYGEMSPGHLGRKQMLDWQTAIADLSPATRRSYTFAVSKFVRWMHAEGHIFADLSSALGRVKEPRRAPRTLTGDQVAHLLFMAGSVDRLIITLMVELGLRCIEVARLDVDDIDLERGTMFVQGKGSHERILPLTETAQKALSLHIADRGSVAGPLLVPIRRTRNGRLSAGWISQRVAAAMTAAGIHIAHDGRSAHSLRRTAASDVLDRSHDIRAVQQLLGHANLATTEVYLRRADLGRLRDAMEGRSYGRTG